MSVTFVRALRANLLRLEVFVQVIRITKMSVDIAAMRATMGTIARISQIDRIMIDFSTHI